jgi:hypothetical protein
MIAVVTWTRDDEVFGVTRAPYSELIVWGRRNIKPKYCGKSALSPELGQIDVNGIDYDDWECLGVARLYELSLSPYTTPSPTLLLNPPIAHCHAHIDWTESGSLVVVVPVIPTTEQNLPAKKPFNSMSGSASEGGNSQISEVTDIPDVESQISDDFLPEPEFLISILPQSLLLSESAKREQAAAPHSRASRAESLDLTDTLRAHGAVTNVGLEVAQEAVIGAGSGTDDDNIIESSFDGLDGIKVLTAPVHLKRFYSHEFRKDLNGYDTPASIRNDGDGLNLIDNGSCEEIVDILLWVGSHISLIRRNLQGGVTTWNTLWNEVSESNIHVPCAIII